MVATVGSGKALTAAQKAALKTYKAEATKRARPTSTDIDNTCI